ncbi:MAG: WD40 repeat domain-containing protein [Rhodopirellula sp.]|nr:WD40 repeat domain-containing protein [Rhodopirellula sp.]
MRSHTNLAIIIALFIGLSTFGGPGVFAQPKKTSVNTAKPKVIRDEDLPYPPTLPNGEILVTDTSPKFLQAPETLREGVKVAKTAPTIDFAFYQNQNYPGKPWSNWGDGSVANGKYYSAIGDHYAIGRGESQHSTGTAFVYEYDPETKTLRSLVDLAKLLKMPEGHYTPGKIHSRVDMGSDGWLYYGTHRGSPRAANDANHYKGDWIFRTNPKTGVSEVVVHGPIPRHSIPNSVLDPERMIFYGGTAAGPDSPEQSIQFFAYDLKKHKLLYSQADGPARYMILSKSTGRLYFVRGNSDGELFRYDPAKNTAPVSTGQTIGVRAATDETPDGLVYTVSTGQGTGDATLWKFNTRTEKVEEVGTIAVGSEAYVASIDIDPTGRYLYYVPGAHGGGYRDGSPLVQYDLKTNTRKVIAFHHPFYEEKYGFIPKGTYSTAISPEGDKVYITWNVSRGTRAWDCCGLTVVHIPISERQP